jgi:hypothetical protein
MLAVAALPGCGDGPTELEGGVEPFVPNPALGLMVFQERCSGCHTTRDAFDLAYFGFSDSDIVRRAVVHVDSTEARHIAAYVRSLDVAAAGSDARPFQPGGRVASSDLSFWTDLFGTSGFPADLTVQALRAMDPREVAIPLTMARWSVERNQEDWLPDEPLPEELLAEAGGRVRVALDAYYASPDETHLVRLLEEVDAVSRGDVCAGSVARHRHPSDCFDVRRWFSSLTAQHYLRPGRFQGSVPPVVSQLWWDTGEAAVSQRFAENLRADAVVRNAARWMYLAFSFGPERFPETQGYFGQHTQSAGYPRLATFAHLRRMVDEDMNRRRPIQMYTDLSSAVTRAPDELDVGAALFGFRFIRDQVAAGVVPSREELQAFRIAGFFNGIVEMIDSAPGFDAAAGEELESLAEEALEGLGLH